MLILVIGLNHKTTPINVREKFAIKENELPYALEELLNIEDINEGFILCTCNRLEIYCQANDKNIAINKLKDFISNYFGESYDNYSSYFYIYQDSEAIRHFIRVASSLDSLVVGEPHILGQVKKAFFIAKRAGAIGPIWHQLFEKSLKIVKRIKRETAISDNPVSVSSVAAELAHRIFGNLKGRKVLIIGAGEMSELAALHIKEKGAEKIYVSNRTYQKAKELADKLSAENYPFEKFMEIIPEVDIIISSIYSEGYILQKEALQKLANFKKHESLFIIDIAVPRNIDPQCNEIANVYLYDIDDLTEVAESNKKQREKEAILAEAIIDKEIHSIYKWLDSLKIYPTIKALQERAEFIRRLEIEEMNRKINGLTLQQKEKIDIMTKSLVKRLINPLIEEIKSINENKEDEKINWLKRIFKLG